jgi:hypothetical protein
VLVALQQRVNALLETVVVRVCSVLDLSHVQHACYRNLITAVRAGSTDTLHLSDLHPSSLLCCLRAVTLSLLLLLPYFTTITQQFRIFLERLDALRAGEAFPFTLQLRDPLGNSFIGSQSYENPEEDPQIQVLVPLSTVC